MTYTSKRKSLITYVLKHKMPGYSACCECQIFLIKAASSLFLTQLLILCHRKKTENDLNNIEHRLKHLIETKNAKLQLYSIFVKKKRWTRHIKYFWEDFK